MLNSTLFLENYVILKKLQRDKHLAFGNFKIRLVLTSSYKDTQQSLHFTYRQTPKF